MYIDLLKQALTHSLWDETTQPLEASRIGNSVVAAGVELTQNILSKVGLRLVLNKPTSKERKRLGCDWPEYAHTMVGPERLSTIEAIAKTIFKDKTSGDFMECGVWRGGSAIFMRGLMEEYKENRVVILADSFEGLPKSSREEDKNLNLHKFKCLAVSLEEVKDNFRKYGLLGGTYFIKGFFEDTLSKFAIPQLALLRIDGDMYSSTMVCLEQLYNKVSSGGYIIIDDYYAMVECKKAVDDFRKKYNITEPVIDGSHCEIYWRKI